MTTAASASVLGVFQSAGLSPAASQDLAGVLTAESGLKTGSQGNSATDASGVLSAGGGAYGIASWNGSRQTDLANYAASVGGSPSDLNTQAGFVVQELQQPQYAASWSALTDPNSTQAQRVSALVTNYENPASYNVSPEIARATTASNGLAQVTPATTAAAGGTTATGAFSPGAASGADTAAASTAAGTASTVAPTAAVAGAETSALGSITSALSFVTSAAGVKRIVAMVGGLCLCLLALTILARRQQPAPVQEVTGALGAIREGAGRAVEAVG